MAMIICVDFRRLNSITRTEEFYIPLIEEIVGAIGQSTIISAMDLAKGFHQVPMDSAHQEKTAFVCLLGRFEYTWMPFGLNNAFQAIMEEVLVRQEQHPRVYIDDIVIFSGSWQEHLSHVRQVLASLRTAGLTANSAKSSWGGQRMIYLGHVIGSGKLCVPPDRAAATNNYVRPTTKKGLRSFLGGISFYRHFIPNIAKFASRLTPAIAMGAPSWVDWTLEMSQAFNHLKSALIDICVLTVPTHIAYRRLFVGIGGSFVCLQIRRR